MPSPSEPPAKLLVRHVQPSSSDPAGAHRIVMDRPEARNAISRRFLSDLDAALDSALSFASSPSPLNSPGGYLDWASRRGSSASLAGLRRSSSSDGKHPGNGGNTPLSTSSSPERPSNPLRCLLFESTCPTVFCAGADLVERKSMNEEEVVAFLGELRRVLDRISAFPAPTLAVLDGAALGGGLELALACDFRIASSAVEKLGFPETRLGIIPGAGGTQRAPRLIGQARAKELIFTGKHITATEAHQWGLVDHLANHKEGQTAASRSLELAGDMSKSAPLALAAAKAAISVGLDQELDEGLTSEAGCYSALLDTEDRREALAAFAEKRQPCFVGR